MVSDTEKAVLALQKYARMYLRRKSAGGGGHRKGRKGGRGRQPKTKDMQAMIIQQAFRKYQVYKRTH